MEEKHVPHVVFLPFPVQGHIKPMLKLAELLSLAAGFQVTFVNTDHNHERILRYSGLTSFYNRFTKFQFMSIPDGLPYDHPRSGMYLKDVVDSTITVSKPAFRQLLILLKEVKLLSAQPPTCIIADGIMSFAIDIAEEFDIPVISFRTYCASCLWTCFNLPKLIEEGEVPFPDGNMDKSITCISGLENVLRRRDLPSICKIEKADDPIMQFLIRETLAMTRASGLILNTIKEIEAPIISELSSLFNKIYTIGPLHALFKSRINGFSTTDSSNGNLWKEDKSCITWLDAQPSRSVLYVSFGSLVQLTRDQMLEFSHGIINSGKPFLWVIRSDSIIGDAADVSKLLMEFKNGAKEKGSIVGWAPQEEVLVHPAIGGFLTHSGWNSTLESIAAGVPMICWPQFADQPVNSRCVSGIWKIGIDMMDTWDRSTVEKLVKDLIDERREEIAESSNKIASMADNSIKEGGSSYISLEKLIKDIRSMNS